MPLYGVIQMSSITANEILDIACYQWAGTKEIMRIGSIGEGRALKVKREIRDCLIQKGYTLPKNKVPMESVLEYFKINLNYLKSVKRKKEK